MKYCPNCQTTYTDETLRFCLQDGTQLVEETDADSDMPTVAFDESATIVSQKPPQRVVRINVPETPPQDWEQTAQPRVVEQPPVIAASLETKKSNTALTVLATVLGMLVLFGGLGAWFLLKSRKTEVVVANVNSAPANRPANTNSANVQIANVNANKPAVSPTPLPKPTLKPEAAKAVTNEVTDTVDEWKSASESLDLDWNLDQYADAVDYYKAGRISRSKVRADKQRAFDRFDSINFKISNMQVTPDASGEKATAVFDKEWTFEGADKRSAGKVQQQLTLGKIGGRWLITSEKDLKTYYVEK